MRAAWIAVAPLFAVSVAVLAGCSAAPSIAGTWAASDGSPTKIIDGSGNCSGMYYNGTKPLDIGGPETCTLSSSATNGHYTLVVRQPPNQETFDAAFDGNTMTLSMGGSVIVTLTKQ